jgi:hypothetical protein
MFAIRTGSFERALSLGLRRIRASGERLRSSSFVSLDAISSSSDECLLLLEFRNGVFTTLIQTRGWVAIFVAAFAGQGIAARDI